MEFVIVLAVLCVVVLVITSPLWRSRTPEAASPSRDLAELEAAREAKYREIRDAELDYRTGKLSETDYEAIDRTLRAQAMEILRSLEHAKRG